MGVELTEPQERALAIFQALAGISGVGGMRQTADGVVTVELLPVDIGQALSVRPFTVSITAQGVLEVVEDSRPPGDRMSTRRER